MVLIGKPSAPFDAVGNIEVRMPDSGCSIEARDTRGESKAKYPCNAKNDKELLALSRKATCDLGGDVFYMETEPANATAFDFHVGRYRTRDESADLALVCAPLSTLRAPRSGDTIDVSKLDASQLARVRAAVLEESLTTPHWRRWLFELDQEGKREASIKTLREAVKAAHIDCKAEWLAPASVHP